MKDLSSFLTPCTDTSDLNPDVCKLMEALVSKPRISLEAIEHNMEVGDDGE
jgi:hypothetical protein